MKQIGVVPLSLDWLTRQQAADYLQVTTRTLDRYIRAGTLRAFQRVQNGAVRISANDLERLLEGNVIEGQKKA